LNYTLGNVFCLLLHNKFPLSGIVTEQWRPRKHRAG